MDGAKSWQKKVRAKQFCLGYKMNGASVEGVDVAERRSTRSTRPPPTIYHPLLQGPAWFITHPARTPVKTEPNVPSDVVSVKQEPLEVPASVFCSVSPDEPAFKPDPSPCKIETPPGETDACKTQLEDPPGPNNDPCNSPLSSCPDSPLQEDTDLPPCSPSTQSQTLEPGPDLSLPLKELHRPTPPNSSCHPPDTTPLVSLPAVRRSVPRTIPDPFQPKLSSLPAVTRSVPRVIPDPVQPKPSNTSLQPCYVRLERLNEAVPTVIVKRQRGSPRKESVDGRTAERNGLLQPTAHRVQPSRNRRTFVTTEQTTVGPASGLSTNQIPDQSTRPSSVPKRKIVKDDISSIVRLRLTKIPGSHHASINRPTRDGSSMEVGDKPDSPADEPDSPSDEPNSLADEPNSLTDEPYSPAEEPADDEESDEERLGSRKKPAGDVAKRFKCNNCSQLYTRKDHLKTHQLKCQTGIRPDKTRFYCKHCSRILTGKWYFDVHVCKDNSFKGYKCDTCGKVLKGKMQFKIHEENHRIALTLPKVFPCPTCRRKCETQFSLELHQRAHKNLNRFECDTCKKVYKHKGTLANHVLTHINPKPRVLFTCATCSKGFKDKSNLALHMRVHTEFRPFPCADCDKRFKSHQDLRQHGLVHKLDRPFRCSVCDKGFRRLNDVTKHEQIMHIYDEKAPNYPCPTCGKIFKKPWSLKIHLPFHTARRDFVCKECSKGFKTRFNLRYHMISHSDARPYKCGECDKAFKTNGNMKKHHKVIHSSDKPFACDVCSKTFRYREALKNHVLTHLDDRPYACTKCDKRYRSPGQLKMHALKHNEKKLFSCHLCTRGFNVNSQVTRHVSLCLTKPHKCKPCALGFRSAEQLDRHLLRHGKKKQLELRFECDRCGKRFAWKSNLTQHIHMVHADGRPYACKFCDNTYKTEHCLKKHCIITHPHETILSLKNTS